ncbi:MAG: hypothetical protein RSB95_01280 [Bacilli bacterium]
MKFVSNKTKPNESIAFAAINSAVVIVLVTIFRFVPFGFVFFALLIPCLATFVSLSLKSKYYLLYFLATILISFAITFDMMWDTIFYIIPGMICGYFIGLFIKNKINIIYSILFSTIINLVLQCFSLILINFVFETDLIASGINLFGLANYPYTYLFIPIFLFILSLIETSISFGFSAIQFDKLNLEANCDLSKKSQFASISLFSIILSIIFAVSHVSLQSLSFIFGAFALYFTLFSLIDIKQFIKKILPVLLSSIIVSFIIFIFTYKYINHPLEINIFLVSLLITNIYTLIMSKLNKI